MGLTRDNEKQTDNKSSAEGAKRTKADECCSRIPGCCSTDVGEMTWKGCPFTTVIKRRRAAVYASLVGVGIALLTIPIGAVLGIIAFFRTF